MPRFRRIGRLAAVLAGVFLAAASIEVAAALAPPAGTTVVAPTVDSCATPRPTLRRSTECGAALVQRWLRAQGQASVVAMTVIVAPERVAVWRSSTTGSLCGFSSLATQPSGLHHCDRITFVDPRVDAAYVSTPLHAFVVLAHESAHGVHERYGKDPVLTYAAGDAAGLRELEAQADCWAGAAMNWAVRDGRFTAADWAGVRGWIRSMSKADAFHDPGPVRERNLIRGYGAGPRACGVVLTPRRR